MVSVLSVTWTWCPAPTDPGVKKTYEVRQGQRNRVPKQNLNRGTWQPNPPEGRTHVKWSVVTVTNVQKVPV